MGKEPVSDDARAELLAVYGGIDACGGVMSPEEIAEGGDFSDGYALGLERALMVIDEALNRGHTDHAWIEEGWKRFRDAVDAQDLKRGHGQALQEPR